jgi:hypothetical protein
MSDTIKAYREFEGEYLGLLNELSPRELRKALKQSYRRVGNMARQVAVNNLNTSGLKVQGNKRDWEKGIRLYNYSKGGGFMVTIKPVKAGRGEKSMHANRYYGKMRSDGTTNLRKLPILMWQEDGTGMRKTKTKRLSLTRRRKGHNTGRLSAVHFLQRSEPEMTNIVESEELKELDAALERVARKSGII